MSNKRDTCSKFGLFPFVPNNEDTFERVRAFLYDKKSHWNNYTGTINEKISVFHSGTYYLSTEQNSIIWPYGSFGVYFPYNGGLDSNGTSRTWGSSTNQPGWMSGSPMHNISSITSDYSRLSNDEGNSKRDYYNWGVNRAELGLSSSQAAYSNLDTNTSDGNYPYSATMGAKGWKSVLSDLNKTNEWFISRTGAGANFDHSSNYPYFEPNGNYSAGAWLNFLFDSNGRVRHNDDWNDNYPYYDYMCMAEDNYDFTVRYTLISGPFKAIEHTVANGQETTNTSLKTKIVNDTLRFDIAILNDSLTAVSPDKNVSVGIFLDDTYQYGNVELARDIHYFGDIKMNGNGTFNALKTTGRFEIPAAAWPSSTNKWPKANKRLFFKFKYCTKSDYEWTDCWTQSGSTATCKAGQESYCKSADSNDFAVRPKNYDVQISGTEPYKAGKGYSVTFSAKDYNGNYTQDFNESIPLTYTETKANCITGNYDTNLSTLKFENGVKTIASLSYDEVGIINIKVKENSGSEFAIIDSNDSSTDRFITAYDQNISYSPDHFSLLNSNFRNFDTTNNFTYVSNDLNMSSELNVTIIAQTEADATTKNYNKDCYAQPTDYTISYSSLNLHPTNALSKVKYLETNTSSTGLTTINTKISLANISKNLFSTDNNGTGKLNFKINFDRNASLPVSPFDLTVRDINATDTNSTFGTKDLNQTARFFYGRVFSTDYRGENSIPATIRYETYCDMNCTTYGLTVQSPVSFKWYQNPIHTNNDGNVSLFKSTGTSRVDSLNDTATSLASTQGLENHTISLANGTTAPYSDKIQMYPSKWLIFSLYDSNASHTDFNVEFVRSGAWAGEGKLGKTVDVNTSIRTNKRMEW